MRLENEPAIIVEARDETRHIGQRAGIDPARGDEIVALSEARQRPAKTKLALVVEAFEPAGGFLGIAAAGQKGLEPVARLTRQPRTAFEGRLFEEAFSDFAGAPAADRRDAGDGEQIFDQRPRPWFVHPFERGKDAGMVMAVGTGRRRVENGGKCFALGETPPDAAAPLRRERQCIEHIGQKPRVPDLGRKTLSAGGMGRFKRNRQDFGIGRLEIGIA